MALPLKLPGFEEILKLSAESAAEAVLWLIPLMLPQIYVLLDAAKRNLGFSYHGMTLTAWVFLGITVFPAAAPTHNPYSTVLAVAFPAILLILYLWERKKLIAAAMVRPVSITNVKSKLILMIMAGFIASCITHGISNFLNLVVR